MRLLLSTLAIWLCVSAPSLAQGTSVPFGGIKHDSSQPVEITADNLDINQNGGTAVFAGNVKLGQGSLRMSATKVDVVYGKAGTSAQGTISTVTAQGDVVLSNGGEAAEAQRAFYNVANGNIEMTGDVILTQGVNALAGEKLVIDLDSGQANISGRVRAILQPNGNQ